MKFWKRGKQATLYLLEYTGQVLWVADQPEGIGKHPFCVSKGWKLCKERLKAPHFPKVYRIGKRENTPCVWMEHIQGGSPTEWNAKEAAAILGELKEANIFHRDVRLENLIERPSGEWALVDFGFSCDFNSVWPAPWYLGGDEYRKAPGVQNDVHAMSIVRKILESR